MKKQRPKYPASLFWSGVALNILRSFLWLVVSTVLLILGNKTPWCGIAGLALLFLVVAIAIVKQLSYRRAVLHSEDPAFADWQAAMLSPDWEDNVKDMVQRAMNDEIEVDEEDEEMDEIDENDENTPSDGSDGGE